MKQSILVLGCFVFFTKQAITQSSFSDTRDDNFYGTVQIGNQLWMSENLKYLPTVNEPNTTSSEDPRFYVYGNNNIDVNTAKETSNYSEYGVLYNWTAAMNNNTSSIENPSEVQGICPEGWHLPSKAEWDELSTFLGGNTVAGGALKTTGSIFWNSPNTGATNSSGFSARAGGQLDSFDGFDKLGEFGYWWTATEEDEWNAYAYDLGYNHNQLFSESVSKDYGFCIRCVSNTPPSTSIFENNLDFKIYPNPTSSFITIKNSFEFNSFEIQIIDLTGKVLINDTLNENETLIDVNSLLSGIYFVKIQVGNYSIKQKLIIQ